MPAVTEEAIVGDSDRLLQIEELLNPAAYAHAVSAPKVNETHISWVILTGEYAYKIKKRLKLDFLDTTTLATRRFLCEEELRLNQRFSSGLYLNVSTITRDASGIHMGGAGTIIDYAVQMRQFDASQELPALLLRGDVTSQEMTALATRLADFHSQAPVAADHDSIDYAAHLRSSVLGAMATLLVRLRTFPECPEMGPLIDWTHDSLHDLHGRFRERQINGFIRECHADLHAHNIVRWRGRLTPFDCLEFDPKLRWIDVMDDVAFLFMDLIAHGRKDLAYDFLSTYVEQTGDYDGIRVLPLYAIYRALVRAMVDVLDADQRPAHRLELSGRLQGRISTALQLIHSKQPSLVIMHGPSGSGKSWLSERLVSRIGAVRIRSDLERKRLANHSAGRGAELDFYAPEVKQDAYSRLLRCTESCLCAGVNVIVDAAFLNVQHRRLFKDLANRLGIPFVIMSCVADKSEMARRVTNRQSAKADPSDATVAVLDEQIRTFEPLRTDELPYALRVDTMQPNPHSAAFAMLQAREMNLVRRPELKSREDSGACRASHLR